MGGSALDNKIARSASLQRGRSVASGRASSLLECIQFFNHERVVTGTPFDHGVQRPSAGDLSQYEDEVSRAFDLIEAMGGGMAQWLRSGIRAIYATSIGTSGLFAASSELFAGVIEIGLPCEPQLFGELLVHEAAHQYFSLASSMLVLCPDRAPEAYSPLKKTLRPIPKLLLSYHAILAIAEYYAKKHISHDKDAKRIAYNRECAEGLEVSLDSSVEHMSEGGRLFYSLMRSRLSLIGWQ